MERQRSFNSITVCFDTFSPEHGIDNFVCGVVVVLVYGVEHPFVCACKVSHLLRVVAVVTAKLDRSTRFIKGQLIVGKDVGNSRFGVVGKPGLVRVEHVFAQSLLHACFSYARVVGVLEASQNPRRI